MYVSTKEAVDSINLNTMNRLLYLDKKPELVVFTLTDNPASQSYVRTKMKAAASLGIQAFHRHVPELSMEEVQEEIRKESELGRKIIVQRPVRNAEEDAKLLVPPHLDVDGLTPGSFYTPATPLGILWFIECYKKNINPSVPDNPHICIFGRSKLVGKPLALSAIERGYTVTVCNSKTQWPELCARQADILVSATGVPGLIDMSLLSKKSNIKLIVDVGINHVNGKLVGDVAPEVSTFYDVTPVPGGVGPLTVAALMNNVARNVK